MHSDGVAAAVAVIARARDLLERVMVDGRGEIIGGKFVGGNGGILSRETMLAAEQLARAFADLDESLGRGGK